MVQSGEIVNKTKILLLDSASSHTVYKTRYTLSSNLKNELRQICDLVTIVGGQIFHFYEDWEVVILLEGAPLICDRTMYVPDALRSVINCCSLWTNDIYVSLRSILIKRFSSFSKGNDTLHVYVQQPMTYMSFALCKIALLAIVQKRQANTTKYTTHVYPWGVKASILVANSKANLWHCSLEHLGITMMWKMILLLIGYDLCTIDAERIEKCAFT